MSFEPDGGEIVRALGGKWRGRHGSARCPAHEDRDPSLSVTQLGDGTVLVKCFAGCEQLSVIAALRELGLWPDRDEEGHPSAPAKRATPRRDADMDLDERKRLELARSIWRRAQPVYGSLAEVYLRSRSIACVLPPTLRYEPQLRHSASNREWPALIGAIQDGTGRVISAQRIYLRQDGKTKADVKPNKLTLGPMRDGAVRLGRAGRALGIAEGIETGLSAAQIYSLPVWAALGASRMHGLAIPDCVEHVVLFADNGPAGEAAAQKAADEYARRGREISIEFPAGDLGDFNDQLRGRDAA